MHTPESSGDCLALVASAADLCIKPWKHAVLKKKSFKEDPNSYDNIFDMTLIIKCRDSEGDRHPENDLEIEIFQSGKDINLMVSWLDQPDRPILWHGKHSVWLDGISGKRCKAPLEGAVIEAFARRLKAFFPQEV